MVFHPISGSPFVTALGWTLVNSLWQVLLIWVSLQVLRNLFRRADSRIRYHISVTALVASTSWFFVTFYRQFRVQELIFQHESALSPISLVDFSGAATPMVQASANFSSAWMQGVERIQGLFPALILLYFLGIIYFTFRLTGAFYKTQRLSRTGSIPADLFWEKQLQYLKTKLSLTREVRLIISTRIDVPVMIGWIKPAILLPLAMMTCLSPEQVEAILIHELAHIKRQDYLVNLLQCVAETLLFFNPFVWLLSRQIRAERENCCDDMVLSTVHPMQYARALVTLEENRMQSPALAMASVSGKQLLFQRIKRMMDMKTSPLSNVQKLVTVAVFIAALASMAWLSPAPVHHQAKQAASSPVLRTVNPLPLPTGQTQDTTIKKPRMVFVDNAGNVNYYDDTSELSDEDRAELDQLKTRIREHSSRMMFRVRDDHGDSLDESGFRNFYSADGDSDFRFGRGKYVYDFNDEGQDSMQMAMMKAMHIQMKIQRIMMDSMRLKNGLYSNHMAYYQRHTIDSIMRKNGLTKKRMMYIQHHMMDSAWRDMKFQRDVMDSQFRNKAWAFARMDADSVMRVMKMKWINNPRFMSDSLVRLSMVIRDSELSKMNLKLDSLSRFQFKYRMNTDSNMAYVMRDMFKLRRMRPPYDGLQLHPASTRVREIIRSMEDANLIKDPEKYSLRLDRNGLYIDGKKQPQDVFERYHNMIGKDGTVDIKVDHGNESININNINPSDNQDKKSSDK